MLLSVAIIRHVLFLNIQILNIENYLGGEGEARLLGVEASTMPPPPPPQMKFCYNLSGINGRV